MTDLDMNFSYNIISGCKTSMNSACKIVHYFGVLSFNRLMQRLKLLLTVVIRCHSMFGEPEGVPQNRSTSSQIF